MKREPQNPERRIVRTTALFYSDLDDQLGPARGSDGQPSAHDFLVHELLRVIDHFATAFESLPEHVEGRSDVRVLVTSGLLVPVFAIVGQLTWDAAVELIALQIDFEWPQLSQ